MSSSNFNKSYARFKKYTNTNRTRLNSTVKKLQNIKRKTQTNKRKLSALVKKQKNHNAYRNKKIYFFDDDELNTPSKENLSPEGLIEFIKLKKTNLDCDNVQTKYHKNSSPLKIDFDPRNNGSRHNYHVFLRDKCLNKSYGESLYLDSGLKKEHFKLIRDNIDNISCIVLDWDRTISLIEGLITDDLKNIIDKPQKALESVLKIWRDEGKFLRHSEKWSNKELAEYFLHDPLYENRVSDMSKTFNLAQQNGVPIFIVTANDVPDSKKEQLFIDIFSEIKVKLNKGCIFGGEPNGIKYPKKENVIIEHILPIIYEQSQIQKRDSHIYERQAQGKARKRRKTKKKKHTF